MGAKTIEAKRLFADVMSDVMTEMGHDRNNYTDAELIVTVKECCTVFDEIWEEFLAEALYGNNKKERTHALIRMNIRRGSVLI